MDQLYVVPTPIGNLEDITLRALEVLKSVDYILCEDTRVTRRLLNHFKIEVPLESFHQNNEHKVLNKHLEALKAGKSIALVSDAGTPAISDPGFLLTRACAEEQISVITLPGASALLPALVNSGLPCEKFIFEGFLPHKKGRKTRLNILAQEKNTFVLYASPHRLIKTLGQLIEYCGADRKASISREISKKFEETVRGDLQYLYEYFSEKSIKGEFVIVVNGVDNK